MNRRNWTEEEEQLLKELAPKVYIRELAKLFNRTDSAVIKKAKRMNLKYITSKKEWTEEELKYIKDNWGIIPITEIARNLKVSRMMVQTKADLMSLPKLGNNPYKKWNDEEIKKLKTLAKKKTIAELSKYFNTTNSAITTVASKNNIILIDSKIHWTEEENKQLKKLAKTMDLSEISIIMKKSTSSIRLQAKRQNIEIIPNKKYSDSIWTNENTVQLKQLASEGKTRLEISMIMNKKDQTIAKKAKELNIELTKDDKKDWSSKEIEKLRKLSKTKKVSELVRILNRSTSSIKTNAKKHNINIMTDRKNWTEEEFKLLEKFVMVDKKSPNEIAEILGRTEDAIIIKISRRGLQIQTNDKRDWTEEEEIMLSDLWGNKSVEYIAKKLNRTISSIRNKAFF